MLTVTDDAAPAITEPEIGIAVMVVSIVLTTILVLFQTWIVRRTNSVAIARRLTWVISEAEPPWEPLGLPPLSCPGRS